jgi:hypothetical protein
VLGDAGGLDNRCEEAVDEAPLRREPDDDAEGGRPYGERDKGSVITRGDSCAWSYRW